MHPLWNEIAAKAGIALTESQVNLFNRYLDLLLAANQRMNLTRIVDRPSAEVQHIADSVTLLPFIPKGSVRIADVGSGGGVPGIPLAIARPDCQVLLIEATKKKAAFLTEAAGQLGLSNVHVLDLRVEEAAHLQELRESFDVAVCRAVATLDWLAEWCLPLVRIGGKMLAMKGPKASEELPAAGHSVRLVGGGSPLVHPAGIPGAANHVIIEIPKKQSTASIYPRHPTAAKGKAL